MGDDHHSAFEALQCDRERLAHVDIQVIGGLNQQKQSEARLLTARKSSHRLECTIPLEAEPAQMIAHALFVAFREIRAAQNAYMPEGIAVRPQLLELLLGKVADAQVRG